MPTVVTERADAPVGFFEAEAAGLRWLREATASGGAALSFGAALARTHSAGADAFGSPPARRDGHALAQAARATLALPD